MQYLLTLVNPETIYLPDTLMTTSFSFVGHYTSVFCVFTFHPGKPFPSLTVQQLRPTSYRRLRIPTFILNFSSNPIRSLSKLSFRLWTYKIQSKDTKVELESFFFYESYLCGTFKEFPNGRKIDVTDVSRIVRSLRAICNN